MKCFITCDVMLNSPVSAQEGRYLEREDTLEILYFICFHLSLLILGYLETWKEKGAARENPAEQEMHLSST